MVTLADLTPRQRAVAECVAEGWHHNATADELGLSVHSVKNHASDIYRILHDAGVMGPDDSPQVRLALWVREQRCPRLDRYRTALEWYDKADPEEFELDCGERAGRALWGLPALKGADDDANLA